MGHNGRVVGIDGCRSGWVVATLDTSIEVAIADDLSALVAAVAAGDIEALGIDMPLGLPEAGPRAADREARVLLGRRRSSLFPTPVASCIEGTDYADVNRLARAADGRGVSRQAFNLFGRIREARAVIDASLAPRVSEVHPETSFAVMAGAPMAHPKRTAAGRQERIGVLERELGPVGHLVERRLPGAAADDIADALAAAWTAARIADGTALMLGEPDRRDADGFALTIAV